MMPQTLEEVFARWPEIEGINDTRKRAIKLMLKNGWVLDSILPNSHRGYKFRKPDVNGWHDEIIFRHPLLNPLEAAEALMEYDFDLKRRVEDVLFAWIEEQEAPR